MQSDTILQQEQIIQHEDIVDRDISKVPQILDISKKRFEDSSKFFPSIPTHVSSSLPTQWISLGETDEVTTTKVFWNVKQL